MYIPVNRILVNEQAISEEHVDDFVVLYEHGRKTKPITVREWFGNRTCDCPKDECLVEGWYVLVDGRHRLAAHKILGREMILVDVTL